MPISPITCITPEPEDNFDSFGSSIAINNKYLAIGDFSANRVAIYTRDNSGQWNRSKIVLPPEDFVIPERANHGFGDKLHLDGNLLVVSNFNQRYLVNLDAITEVKPIDSAIEKSNGLATFNLLVEGTIRKVTLSDRGERNFGICFSHCKNLLLVGSPSNTEERGAWLYDLNRLDREPEKLDVPNVLIGTTVALNEEFAVVGDYDYKPIPFRDYGDVSNRPKLTLIRAIKSGLTTTVDIRGKLSLSGNILAFVNPYNEIFLHDSCLQLRRITRHPSSRLVLMRGYVAKAFVQNGFLITVYDNFDLGRHEIHIQEIT